MESALILFIALIGALSADSFEERARSAESLLKKYRYREAFCEYSALLQEELPSLEVAYWIHRERGFAACMLGYEEAALLDIKEMKHIFCELEIPEDLMEEYYYVLNLARQARQLYSGVPCCGGFTSWAKDKWDGGILRYENFKRAADKAYFRVTNNELRLEQLEAEKRAKQLYYPNLVHSKETIESFSRQLEERDQRLLEDFKDFLKQHKGQLMKESFVLAADAQLMLSGTVPGFVVGGGLICIELQELWEDTGAQKMWIDYKELKQDYKNLESMNKENRRASYDKCILEGRAPAFRFASEKDTYKYNTYYMVNADRQGYDFQVNFGKPF